MKPKIILGLALVFLAGLALTPPVLASVVIFQVFPTNVSDHPISVQVADADFGKHFTVFYKTNETTSDEFLHAELVVSSEDYRIAACPVEKTWTTNGVQFEFTVSSAYVSASKFTMNEWGHVGKQQMPGFTSYWFYLREFATNHTALIARTKQANEVSPEIIRVLPARIQELSPGLTADEVWNQLFRTRYQHNFGGVSYGEHERWWLAWNYELELYFEEPPTNRPDFDQGKRKLIRAVLYKNGREISRSGK